MQVFMDDIAKCLHTQLKTAENLERFGVYSIQLPVCKNSFHYKEENKVKLFAVYIRSLLCNMSQIKYYYILHQGNFHLRSHSTGRTEPYGF